MAAASRRQGLFPTILLRLLHPWRSKSSYGYEDTDFFIGLDRGEGAAPTPFYVGPALAGHVPCKAHLRLPPPRGTKGVLIEF
jgi:hypothetical protein